MEFLVVYFSRGGKTRKVAEAVAQELGCKSVDITKETPDLAGVDMLLVGSGNYGGKTDNKFLMFLNNLQTSSDKKAAVFATAGGPEAKVIYVLEEALVVKGYKVVSKFKCLGQILNLNKGHPNEDDLKNAKAFARDLKKTGGA